MLAIYHFAVCAVPPFGDTKLLSNEEAIWHELYLHGPNTFLVCPEVLDMRPASGNTCHLRRAHSIAIDGDKDYLVFKQMPFQSLASCAFVELRQVALATRRAQRGSCVKRHQRTGVPGRDPKVHDADLTRANIAQASLCATFKICDNNVWHNIRPPVI